MNKDLAERLLFAAQEVANDAECHDGAVDPEIMGALKAVVKEVNDEAERMIRAILAERKE